MKKYIDIDGMVYKVKKFKDDKKLSKGNAYVRGKYAFPYMGILDDTNDDIPGIYFDDDKEEYIFRLPISKKIRKKYLAKNIYTDDDIYDILENEDISSDDDIIIGDNTDVFCPVIQDDDNILQILIKKALMKKRVDLNAYKNRFDSPSDMSNRKNALMHHGKMSLEKFIKWCDILDLSFDMEISDKSPSVPNPIKEPINYSRK